MSDQAFEYNAENLTDVWNRAIDERESLARLRQFVRSMGMAGTEVAGALEDADEAIGRALAGVDRRLDWVTT